MCKTSVTIIFIMHFVAKVITLLHILTNGYPDIIYLPGNVYIHAIRYFLHDFPQVTT